MAGITPTRLAAATVAIALLASPLVPAVVPAGAQADPTASLGYLFRDNGAHFSVKAWDTAMGLAGLGVSPKRLGTLKAKWKAAGPRQKTVLNDWVNRVTLGPVFPPFRDALAVCKRFYGGNKDWKSYCTHWWGSHAIEVTGWQYMPYGESDPTTWTTYHGQMAKGGSIEVYAMPYFTKIPADRGGNITAMITDNGAIQLPVDFPHANRAWLAPDSPLPLMAFYQFVKRARSTPLKAGANSSAAHREMAAAQLLAFWGWSAPTVFAPGLWRVMAAAGFNPAQAGGLNVPPGAKPPAWRSVFWNTRAIHAEWRAIHLGTRPWGPNNPAPGFGGT